MEGLERYIKIHDGQTIELIFTGGDRAEYQLKISGKSIVFHMINKNICLHDRIEISKRLPAEIVHKYRDAKTKKVKPVEVAFREANLVQTSLLVQGCPVCHGNGLVPSGFYSVVVGQPYTGTSSAPEQCRACEGKGYIKL